MKVTGSIILLTLFFFSCSNPEQKKENINDQLTLPENQSALDKCWSGMLNGKTPVFIHYQIDSNLIIGEITYLNTKERLPIKLLGTIEEDKSYRLLEFEATGNITGVIIGTPSGKTFNGIWVSPKTEKELSMALSLKDTIIRSIPVNADENRIFAGYHYYYGPSGYIGDFEINKIPNGKVDFSILSLTNIERGPNIAEVPSDTISMTGTGFNYHVPDSDSCNFKVKFYKDFVYIRYTNAGCNFTFGLNATVDGIYLKIK